MVKYVLSLLTADTLLAEMRGRFSNVKVRPILLLVPSSIVQPMFRHPTKAWLAEVTEAAKLYHDMLPSSLLLKDQLLTWSAHWQVM